METPASSTGDENVAACTKAYDNALRSARPHLNRLDQANDALGEAEQELKRLRNEARTSGPFHRLRFHELIRQAEANIQQLTPQRDATADQAEPYLEVLDRASRALDDAKRAAYIEHFDRRTDVLQDRGPERPGPSLGLGIG